MDKTPTKLPDEDSYYNRIKGKRVWSTGGLKFILDFIFEKSKKENLISLLELGCGDADIVKFLPPQMKYTGLDPSEMCIAKLKSGNNNFVVGCAEEIPFSGGSFDFIFSGNAFEHFYDPKKSILEMIRVTKPGGYIIIVAPNLEVPWATINAVRHYSLLKKMIFSFKRWIDLGLRIFGVLRFRPVKENYTTATGRFDRADDDLMSVTSTYEVASLLKKRGLKEVFIDKLVPKDNSFKNKIRLALTYIPVLRYYGTGILVIFQKPNEIANQRQF